MKRAIGLSAAGVTLLCASVVLFADRRRDPDTYTNNGTGGAKWMADSTHSGVHKSGICSGTDGAHVALTRPIADWFVFPDGKKSFAWLKQKTWLVYATPFTGIQRVTTPKHATYAAWRRFVSTQAHWLRKNIVGAKGRIFAKYGSEYVVGPMKTKAAHAQIIEESPIETPDPTTPTPAALVFEFFSSGEPSLDSAGDVEFDANGDVVWDVAPAPVARFTSSVSQSGSTTTYTYLVEELAGEDRSFVVREVITAAHPSGWSDTVTANSSKTLVVSVDDETTHTLNSQADLDENDTVGGTYGLPVRVYVPASMVSYDGDVSISSVALLPSGAYEVSFQVTGDDATDVVLFRMDDGVADPIVEDVGLFQPGVTYTIEDASPAPGTNTYMVATGVRTNGVFSDEVSSP